MPNRRPARPSTLVGGVLTAATILATGCAVPDTGRAVSAPTPSAAPGRKLRTPDSLLGLPKSMDRAATSVPQARLEEFKREVGEPTSAIGWAYGGGTRAQEMIMVSAASGRIPDPEGTLTRALRPYQISKVKTVEIGRFGGEARCGRGRTEKGDHLTVCGWADPEIVGVVVFLSAAKQDDRKADFLTVRGELERPAG
ncbi:hypothetical protein [Micromonospora sp. NPDC092111]|uniref:hypothetical protein n=1 Tax=Micromonospora sp. NPDC092111 TaxID=3364289 RepID=UPI00380F4DDF